MSSDDGYSTSTEPIGSEQQAFEALLQRLLVSDSEKTDQTPSEKSELHYITIASELAVNESAAQKRARYADNSAKCAFFAHSAVSLLYLVPGVGPLLGSLTAIAWNAFDTSADAVGAYYETAQSKERALYAFGATELGLCTTVPVVMVPFGVLAMPVALAIGAVGFAVAMATAFTASVLEVKDLQKQINDLAAERNEMLDRVSFNSGSAQDKERIKSKYNALIKIKEIERNAAIKTAAIWGAATVVMSFAAVVSLGVVGVLSVAAIANPIGVLVAGIAAVCVGVAKLYDIYQNRKARKAKAKAAREPSARFGEVSTRQRAATVASPTASETPDTSPTTRSESSGSGLSSDGSARPRAYSAPSRGRFGCGSR